jgi:glycosyltransferase involved in cell wall biosynthesis
LTLFLIAIALLVFLSHFLLVIGKLYFNRENLRPQDQPHNSQLPLLAVVIPARNEELNIERCVTSLLNQTYPQKKYRIIVVDDNSSDNTQSIVQRLKEKHPNLKLTGAGPLPEGWSGKNNACRKGAEIADGKWYCFIDADIYAQPELLETAVTFAENNRIDMLSINPLQELVTTSERLFLPGIFLSIASSMNFKHVNDTSRPETGANGQFMLFRQKVYESINGHYSVRNEIMEDMAFAKIVKNSGYRIYWIFGENLISTRMYRDISHIWEGFSKNLAEIMRKQNPVESVYDAIKSLLLAWMPLLLPFWTFYYLNNGMDTVLNYLAFGLSVSATTALFMTSLFIVRALKIPFGYAFSIPLGLSLHTFLTINSLWRMKKGKRLWKGRIYP